ncbi:MAG TPA: glycosyltransferase family 1 protein [Acidimicrobiales bacterium]|nr:glycosyltransferase family 1 protein [Acidimicrobiales bacterium]
MPVVAISVDQLWRPQPGGIATYVRGLLRGLSELDESWSVVALAPRGGGDQGLSVPVHHGPLGVRALTRLWSRWPMGLASGVDVVHATSLAGPYRGAPRNSVALHDVLWRDEPQASTPAGVRFHERRLRYVLGRDDLQLVVTSPPLAQRLRSDGVDPERIHPVRMGVDDGVEPAPAALVAQLLGECGVNGPYTLYAGTREPRKNLERLIRAHRAAHADEQGLGPLVFVGPQGWGDEQLGDSIVIGPQPRALLKGLVRDAGVFAYVPLREGWGLPAVEALSLGTRVVASSTTPSIEGRASVVAVDPYSEEEIAAGLLRALGQSDDAPAKQRRRESVGELSWRACAQAHVAAWT